MQKYVAALILSISISGYITTGQAQTESYIAAGGSSGVHGANRRVRTQAGATNQPWTYVTGFFTEPTISARPSSAYNSKPEMYLGSRAGQTEVDAGLHFEPRNQRNLRRGWTLYMSQGNNFTYCGRGQTAYSFSARSLGTVEMIYKVLPNGGAELEMRHPTRGYWHMYSANSARDAGDNGVSNAAIVYTSAQRAQLQMKRVIAIAQSNGIFLDGSYMHGAVWSEGRLGVPARDAQGAYRTTNGKFIVTLQPWSNTGRHVSLSETGLVPRGKDEKDNWIVDYPGMRPSNYRNTDGAYRMRATTGRYANEIVDIDLRTHPQRIVGTRATRVRP